MLSKSLIQFFVDGQVCVPSLLFDLRPNSGEGNEDNGDLLQEVPCMHCHTQCLDPAAGHHRPTPPPDAPGHPQTSLGQSLVGSLLLSLGSWCTQGVFCVCVCVCALQQSASPVLCKLWQFYDGVDGDLLQVGLCHTQVCCIQSPCPCCRPLPTHTSTGDTQILNSRSGSVSVGFPGEYKVLFESSACLWQVWGFILNTISPL